MSYRKLFNTRSTPQREPIPGKNQVKNSAGGYVFEIDDWSLLRRFLVLGTDTPTYYKNPRQLTKEAARAVIRCLAADGERTVGEIVQVSHSGVAKSNDPALFALAMASSPDFANMRTRQQALAALPQVARIGTHLFHFAEYVEGFRGWGRALRTAVADWYNSKSPELLGYQAVKYQQRDGWAHRDLLRLSHPTPESGTHNAIYQWITGKDVSLEMLPQSILGFEYAKAAKSEAEIVQLIQRYNLTREMVPTEYLNSPAVWEALLETMPMMAMVRNLNKMTAIGLVAPMSNATGEVVRRLGNADAILGSRLHPMSILMALKQYAAGRGDRGSLSWSPVGQVVDALDAAFYTAFGSVQPTGKRTMLALDVSASMTWNHVGTNLDCAEAATAMALVTAHAETQYDITRFNTGIESIPITPRQRLDDAMRYTRSINGGGTYCSLPMLHALQKKMEVDTFIVYTDNETWYGSIHPAQALREYRQKMGIPAKLIVVAMTPTPFSIADPGDGGMLDVVGFDTSAPAVMSEFARG